MSRVRTLLAAGGLVFAAAAAQLLVVLAAGWLTVLPVAFAGDGERVPAGANRLVSLHVGPLAMLAGAMVARAETDVPLPVAALRGAEVAVYELDGEAEPAALLRPPGPDWLPVVRVRDGEDRVAIFARVRGRRLRALDLLTSDGEYLVHVRVRGRLHRAAGALLAWALDRAAGEDGFELRPGSRRTPPGRPGP